MVASIAYIVATLGVASAHTIMNRISVGGTTYDQGYGIYMPSSDSYQSDVTSNSIACNGAPVTGFKSSSAVIPVNAGDTVTGAWLHTLSSTGADSEADNKVIDSSHKGPVMAYMKKVDDASQSPSNAPGDGWFKVAEAGLITPTQWGVDKLISDGGLQSVTIPSCIAPGDYLLRFELIALHNGENKDQAQFYMECAQLKVSGGGSTAPTTYSIPGIYTDTDPGILVMIYNGQGQPYPSSGKYTIPGPSVFTCDGASSSGNDTAPAAVSTSVSAPAKYTASSSSAAAESTSASSSTAYSAPAYNYASSSSADSSSSAAPLSSSEAAPVTASATSSAAATCSCIPEGYGPTSALSSSLSSMMASSTANAVTGSASSTFATSVMATGYASASAAPDTSSNVTTDDCTD